MKSCDVLIVGGGVIGSAIAYFLAGRTDFKGSIVVVEKDATYETAATPRSAGGVRQQFSTPENIQMSMFGAAFIKSAGEHLKVEGEVVDLPFTEWGYLFLATATGLETLRTNHTAQTALGARVALLTPSELKARFPWLRVDDLAGGCFGLANEGWTDPYGLLQAFRRKARALGATYVSDEVIGLERAGSRIVSASLRAGGRVACGAVVNAAGYHAREIAAMIGTGLPVRPRKRIVYVFDCRDKPERAPLTIDPTGVWCRPEGAHFIGGISPPEAEDPDSTDFEIEYGLYEDVVWPTLAHRIPAFEAIKLVRAWVGHYDYNTLDQNAILGPHPEIGNFYFANGFSGHGLQQSPAVGRAIAECIAYGGYRSLDLRRFGFERVLNNRPILELNVV
ncbi:MAG TPA: FAD-binding oxidoreductase [Candidatus Acidoferrum sp.]|nr:FAD-binding oxidoreductase [Candidatus Acidoferrum sp.]